MENGHVRWKPGAKADKRRRRFPPEILSDVEVRALMDACGGYRPTAVRNRALIALLYRGGLRISEALHLYPKDLWITAQCACCSARVASTAPSDSILVRSL